MAVEKVIWWEHKPGKVGQYSSAKVHQTLLVNADGSYSFKEKLNGLEPKEIEGF
jgi:CRISPR-associated protein Csd2